MSERITNNDLDDESKDAKRIQYYKDFSINTSLHGVKYTAEDGRSIMEKIWWGMMVVGSFCICVFLVAQVWLKWTESPVIVSFDETLTPVWKIPFPAVTICPASLTHPALFNYSSVCLRNGNFTDDNEEELFNFVSFLCDNECKVDKPAKPVANKEVLDMLKEVSTAIEDTLIHCTLFSVQMDCKELFRPILTDIGICFTANVLNARDIYTDEVALDDFFLDSPRTDGWTINDWYPKGSPFKTYPIRAQGTGITSGLSVFVVNNHEHTDKRCCGAFKGFKFAIHPPYVLPHMLDNFFIAQFKAYVTVRVKPEAIQTSTGLKSYEPEKRQCYFSDEKKLRYFKNYTRHNCELECLTNYTLDVCGCVPPSMPRHVSTPLCSEGSFQCVHQAMGELTIMESSADIPADVLNASEISELKMKAQAKAFQCNCFQSCATIAYQPTIQKGGVDWGVLMGNFEEDNNASLTIDLTAITVYMDNPHFMMSKRSELYGIIDFLANCGGLIGVCLGFSILSLVEIIYFFIIRFCCDVAGKIRTKSVATESNLPMRNPENI